MSITQLKALETLRVIPNNSAQKLEPTLNALSTLDDLGLNIKIRGRTIDDQDIVELTSKQDNKLEKKDNGFLTSAVGFGETVLDACQNLLRSISDSTVVKDAYKSTREEIKIPKFDKIA
ncbi:MAG: hypothetical protein ACD_20C00161G0006 [uncultured bacterium]|nr:MAG: hypothetical protein ACD_20C00161G0006 [uncultured bacterium]